MCRGSSFVAEYLSNKGSFLLATQVRQINKVSTGLCPHGLAPGACPICSNMGGGGSLRVGERPQKAGEMSYHECVMQGNIIRARMIAQKRHEANLKHNIELAKSFENLMTKLSTNVQRFIDNVNPNFIQKPIIHIAKNIILPIINFIQNIPKIIQQIQNLKIEIQDKLNAIFGEAKAFAEKKIAELVSNIKTKIKSIFKIFKKSSASDEDTKIDEDKKLFNLKAILHKILRKKKDQDDNNNENK